MIKLISITWSYNSESNIKDSFLYKSFIKNNFINNFINIHFNRNFYTSLEEEFKNKFGYQYEYILYKIFLFYEEFKKIDGEYFIYSDAYDVVCLGDINKENINLLLEKVMFSSEIHQYPPAGLSWNKYSNNIYLNSGLYIGNKLNILKMLEQAKSTAEFAYKDFGGDQGVYTHIFLHTNPSLIYLDSESKLFLNTYLRSETLFNYFNNRLTFKNNNNQPLFIHDNGWNYGSPRFIEKFNLI